MAVCASVVAIHSIIVSAGDLNPPPGPIQPTGVTLINQQTVTGFPIIINQPGSYRLTSDIIGVSGADGIQISADGVSLDLNGFSIIGVAGAANGVRVSAIVNALTITNGSVRAWPDSAISATSAAGAILKNLRVSNNGSDGLRAGRSAVCTDCAALDNGSNGFNFGFNATIRGCSSNNNGAHGFQTGNGASLLNCSARDNTQRGVSAGIATIITTCSAYSNDTDGFSLGSGSLIANCVAAVNGANGILVTTDCRVKDNNAWSNGAITDDGAGVRTTGADNRIEANAVTDNDIGVATGQATNLVIRNSMSGNPTQASPAIGDSISFTINGSSTTFPHSNFQF